MKEIKVNVQNVVLVKTYILTIYYHFLKVVPQRLRLTFSYFARNITFKKVLNLFNDLYEEVVFDNFNTDYLYNICYA